MTFQTSGWLGRRKSRWKSWGKSRGKEWHSSRCSNKGQLITLFNEIKLSFISLKSDDWISIMSSCQMFKAEFFFHLSHKKICGPNLQNFPSRFSRFKRHYVKQKPLLLCKTWIPDFGRSLSWPWTRGSCYKPCACLHTLSRLDSRFDISRDAREWTILFKKV